MFCKLVFFNNAADTTITKRPKDAESGHVGFHGGHCCQEMRLYGHKDPRGKAPRHEIDLRHRTDTLRRKSWGRFPSRKSDVTCSALKVATYVTESLGSVYM